MSLFCRKLCTVPLVLRPIIPGNVVWHAAQNFLQKSDMHLCHRVDANAAIIERAPAPHGQEPLGISYHVSDTARLEMLEDDSFDLVVCNMALMGIENVAGAIEEVARVLRSKGRFVVSLSHPCFDKVNTSGWAIEHMYPTTTIWRKMSWYREIAADKQLPDFVFLAISHSRLVQCCPRSQRRCVCRRGTTPLLLLRRNAPRR